MRFYYLANLDTKKKYRTSVGSLLLFLSLMINVSIIYAHSIQNQLGLHAEANFATTLVAKDTTGDYIAKEGEAEEIDKRTKAFKTFKKIENGKEIYRVAGQIGPIHYKTDPFSESEQYKEIDLTLHQNNNKKNKDYDFYLDQNGYQVNIWNQQKINGQDISYIAKFIRAGESISMAPAALAWENLAGEYQEIAKPVADISPEIDNDNYTITWKNAFGDGIHFRYNISPDKFFKTVIIDKKESLAEPTIGKDGLNLTVVMGYSVTDVESSKGFSRDNKNKDISVDYNPKNIRDEKQEDPGKFSFKDNQNRDLWWLQKPMAWDSAEEQNQFIIAQNLERIGENNFIKLSVDDANIQKSTTQFPFFIDAAISEEAVGASSDDANDSSLTLTAGYINRSTLTGSAYNWGFRFTSIPISQGTTLTSATISPYFSSTSYDDPQVTITGDDADNSVTFDLTTNQPSDRTKTTASVTWQAVGVGGGFRPSVDIDTIANEIIGRAGWASGNSLSILTNTISSSYQGQISTWDYTGNARGAKFNATYEYTGNVTISGTVYSAEDKLTNIGANKTIGLSVNGGAKTTIDTTDGGAFSFSNITITDGQPVALFIDDETEKGSLISNLPSGDWTGIEMFTDKVVLQTEQATTITNATLATANTIADADIGYVVTGSNIDFDDGREVYLIGGENYTPGGTVELDSFEALAGATFNPEANNMTIHGSWKLSTTSVFTSSGTATFDGSSGTQTVDSGSTKTSPGEVGIDNFDFTNFVKNNAGTLQITGHKLVLKTSLTVGTGAILDFNNLGVLRYVNSPVPTLTWNGKIKVTGQESQPFFSDVNYTTGTLEYYGTGDYSEMMFYTSASNTINNLELTGSGTFNASSGGLNKTNGYLLISDGVLSSGFTIMGDYTQSGGTSSAVKTIYGNVDISGGTVNGGITQNATNSDLSFDTHGIALAFNTGSFIFLSTSASNRTISIDSDINVTTGVNGFFMSVQANGTGNLTIDGSINHPDVKAGYSVSCGGSGSGTEYLILGNGTWEVEGNNATFSVPDGSVTPGNSTLKVIQTTNSATIRPINGAINLYNLVLQNSSTTILSWLIDDSLSVANNLQISASNTADITLSLQAAMSFKNIDFIGEGAGTEILYGGTALSHTVSGNIDFTGGTFTKQTSTFTLNGSGAQSITSASQSWNNLQVTNASTAGVTFADSATVTGTFTATTASSKLYFTSGATYAFTNISISGQAAETRILMDSTSHSSHWHFNVTQASPVASYVDVRDSDASGGNTINGSTGGMDRGGNTNWTLNTPSDITISGTVYAAENKSSTLNNKTVVLSVNGAVTATTETNGLGVFDFSWYSVAANNTVAVYVDGETEKGSLITQAADSTTNITGLELYTGHIVLTHNTAGPMTNTLLATADNVADTDLLVSVSGSDATFTSGNEIWILGSKTYTPGGNVTCGSLEILTTGTFTPEANTVTLNDSGTPFTVTGTFNEGTSTIVYAGTTATTVTGSTYKNLTVNQAGTTFTSGGSTTVSGVFTITAGTFDASSQTIILSGTGTPFVNNGTFTVSTSTVKYTGAGNTTVTATDYYHLETSLGGSYTCTFASGTINVNGNYVNGDGTNSVNTTATTNDPTLNIQGSFTNSASATFVASDSGIFSIASNYINNSSATFTHSSGTITFDGTTTQSITSGGDAFNNMTITNTTAEVSQSDDVTISDSLAIQANAIYDINGHNITIVDTLANNGTFRLQGGESTVSVTSMVDSGTVEYDGSGTYTSLKFGNNYYGLKINGSGSWTLGANLNANNLNIAAGTLAASTYTITLSGSGTPLTIVGTFSEGTSTVTYTGVSATNVTGTTYNNLILNHTGVTFTSAGNTTVKSVLTITAGTFDASDDTITLSGSGTPFVNNGTFTASTSTITYNGGGAVNITPVSYNNLTFSSGGSTSYERTITITNSGGTVLTNYQIRVALTSSNFDFSHSTDDGRDVRFYDSTGENNLDFFIESWNQSGQTGVVWVEVPSIPADGTTLKLRYGDSSLASASSGTNTFAFFDDFTALTNWTTNSGSPSVSGGILTLDPQESIRRTTTAAFPISVIAKSKLSGEVTNGYWASPLELARSTNYDYGCKLYSINSASRAGCYNGSENASAITSIADNIYHTFRIGIFSTSHAKFWDNGNLVHTATTNIDSSINDIWFVNHPAASSGKTVSVDWVAAGAYTATEPTISIGTEGDTPGKWEAVGDFSVSGVLNVSSGNFDANSYAVTLSGSGTPFVQSATFTQGTSTIKYTGSSDTNITGTTYYNLELNQSGTTFTAAGDLMTQGVLNVAAGTFNGSNKTITISGSGNAFVVTGTFTPATSTVLYNTNASVNLAGTTYYNLTTSFANEESYYKAITVSNTSGSTLTNYQIYIQLTSSNFNFSNSTNDGRDVRFYSSDHSTSIDFFIESWNQSGQTAALWVEVPSIPTTGTTIYMDYGNSNLTSASSGTNTFSFFDDFASSYTANWTKTAGSPSVSSGILTSPPQSELRKTTTISMPVNVISKTRYSAKTTGGYWVSGTRFGRSTTRDVACSFMTINNVFRTQCYDGTSETATNITNYADNSYHIFRMAVLSTSSAKFWIDGNYSNEITANISSYLNDLYITNHPSASSGVTMYTDWIATGTYSAVEPTYSVGSEVSFGGVASANITVNNNMVHSDGLLSIGSHDLVIASSLTIASGSIFSAAASTQTFSIGGDFANSGTFTHNSGTLTLNGSGVQSITSGGTTFNNLTVTNASASGVTFADSATVAGTFTDTTPSSKLTFNPGSTYAFANISINGQNTSTKVVMTSSAAWYFNVSQASPTVSNVSATNSNASGGNQIDADDGTSYDGGGNINWLFPVANTAPSNDSLTFTNPYSSNIAVADDTTEWNFRVLVTDPDGSTNLDYVELRLANSADSAQPYDSLKFRWTESTDAFSEQADTQTAATLTSTSTNSSANGNQWTLDFKVKLNSSFANTATNYAAELYSIDESSAADTDNYADKFQVQSLSLTFAVDSNTLAFGSLLPGSVITGTSVGTVTTNYPNGYSLSAKDDVAGTNSVLLHSDTSTRITDYAGSIATPTLWSGTGLGISVFAATGKDTSKWGTGTTVDDSNNKYAGVPENSTIIHSKTGSPTASDQTSIGYKLVVPNTQKTGNYSGILTFTATGVLP